MTTIKPSPWSVFHYNPDTREKVPFEGYGEMIESAAQTAAEGIRIGRGRGSAERSIWTITAFPIDPENTDNGR
jgi:hypothetical protein